MILSSDPQICPQCRCAFLDIKLGRINRKEQGNALIAYIAIGFISAVAIVGICDVCGPGIVSLFPLNIAFGLVFWWRNLRKTTSQTIYCHKCGYSVTATQSPSGK
jgi:hypothetical protein